MGVALELSVETGVQESMWDAQRLGRILQGMRHREGYERMADLTLDLERKTGIRRHENTLYDVMNGKRLPDLELLLGLMVTLGVRFEDVVSAVSDEYKDSAKRLLQ